MNEEPGKRLHYGINEYISGYRSSATKMGAGVSLYQVINPTEKLYILDSYGYSGLKDSSTANPRQIDMRHEGKVNAAFVDGHAAAQGWDHRSTKPDMPFFYRNSTLFWPVK